MTTYYEYSNVGNDAEPDPSLVVSGYRASFAWVDPTVDNIFNESGGKAVSINFGVASGHWQNVVVNFEEDTLEDAVSAALAHANTVGPPVPGYILGRLTISSPLYEGVMQIAPI